jgi:hypothetical protein
LGSLLLAFVLGFQEIDIARKDQNEQILERGPRAETAVFSVVI